MSNIAGNAYGLSILSPIKNGRVPGKEIAYADLVRDKLQAWNSEFNSPMALVPQTYLCRFYVLDDVVTESLPGGSLPDTWSDVLPVVPDSLRRDVMPKQDRLQSRYLVFCCNFTLAQQAHLTPICVVCGKQLMAVFMTSGITAMALKTSTMPVTLLLT